MAGRNSWPAVSAARWCEIEHQAGRVLSSGSAGQCLEEASQPRVGNGRPAGNGWQGAGWLTPGYPWFCSLYSRPASPPSAVQPVPNTERKPPDALRRVSECLVGALTRAQEAVEEAAATNESQPGDLATTLMVAVAGPGVTGAAQIGDGAVVVGTSAGELLSLTTPTNGEFINETVFLTSPGARRRFQVNVLPFAASHLAAFTDGIEMLALKMPAAKPHPRFFAPLFRYLSGVSEEEAQRGIEQLLSSPRVSERTDDDVTLVLASRNDA